MASQIEKSIEVDVPVRTAYDQWTQFEQFPNFMEGVTEVRQIDDRRLFWRADVGGREKTWEAVIDEQIPDARIAWHATTGARNAGVVTFHRLDDRRCKVMLQMEYDPEGFTENVGDFLGVASARISGDLGRFKEFIEDRGTQTGAWRGSIGRPLH
ncbi:MAG: SRPBCC family protein [bacterium]|nr:SRPBCC family protein [bacterium]